MFTLSTAVLSVLLLEDQSVLKEPPPNPSPPPASLKREIERDKGGGVLVELIEHFLPAKLPAESAASQTEREKEGEKVKEKGKDRRVEGR